MRKLIWLEYKKNKTEKYLIKAGLILILLLIFFFAFTYLGIAIIEDTDAVEPEMYGRLSEVVTGFVEIVYIVLSASMYASFIIEAYRNKTMNLMFTYPIRRSRILSAKIAAVWVFCLCAQMITRAALFAMLIGAGQFMTPDFLLSFSLTDWHFWSMQLVSSVLCTTMSLIALWIGVWRRSTRVALAVSGLLVLIKKGNVGGFSVRSVGWVPFAMAGLAVLMTAVYLQNVNRKDVPDF